jgi:hypothetical protein
LKRYIRTEEITLSGGKRMDLTGIITGSITILSLFVGLPGIALYFIYKSEKNKTEMIKQQKELLEVEIEKEKIQLRLLEEENRKYDKIIEMQSSVPTKSDCMNAGQQNTVRNMPGGLCP